MIKRKFKPDEFDIKLGNVITMTRHRFGMSQKDIAKKIGVTFQQVQKYECADNRISASTLNKIAACFEMSPAQLLDATCQPYAHDVTILYIIDKMYKMNNAGRRFVLAMVDAVYKKYIE